ncbi:hypothetical protein [Cytobacillus oceanisediminis]|uniref:hypothetical protein n=1 Tax=Cytobacillus oceanisediminis TaxID=665099 RepID=UPI003736BDAE
MRTRQKRIEVKGNKEEVRQEIRNMIEETGMRYVFIPNGLFDELYLQKSLEGETSITELEMVTYIFLLFMSKNKFTLNYEKLAEYLGCSSKQLKVVLKRLQQFKAKTNSVYESYTDSIKLVEEHEVNLITEKKHSAYNPKTKKNQKRLHWYVNYMPYHKMKTVEGKETPVPENFFIVTIDDLDLLLNSTLSRTEFVTYLFLLKAYKYGTDDQYQMYWKISTIAETLNYKLTETVHKHIEKILSISINSIPLLDEIRPKNYDLQIMKGEEPSSRYIPRFNPLKMLEMDFEKKEVSFKKSEVSFKKQEMDFKTEEVDSEKKEVDYSDWEMDLLNEEMSL